MSIFKRKIDVENQGDDFIEDEICLDETLLNLKSSEEQGKDESDAADDQTR